MRKPREFFWYEINQNWKKKSYFFLTYRKVASSNTSRFEAHSGIFRLLMMGILELINIQNQYCAQVSICKFV